MGKSFNQILIIADIEGSSGCWNYRASSFMTPEWARACLAMTLDVKAVVEALLKAGVEHIRVKDFHRTGYNLLPEMIGADCEIIHGYRRGPVPGIGDPGKAQAVIFMGMHAASGTDGFLAHTLTSRIERLEVNGKPLAEIELFASALTPFGVRPIFFSGCPVACKQALAAIENICVYPINKTLGNERFDIESWRFGLAKAAVASLENDLTVPCQPNGPFQALVKMRAGEAVARKLAHRWNLDCQDDQILIAAAGIQELYLALIRVCYLTPLVEKMLPICLFAYNLWGRIGLAWVRRQIKECSQPLM
ncbi:MAG: M55 family metallopeptidase [Desulfobacterales bacterium]|nr:MAG: M55 family metallopeptidase [Desulfobacterales bacterium]